MLVHYASLPLGVWVSGFVQLDKPFDVSCCGVQVYVFPFGVMGDECFTVHDLSYLGLEGFCGVVH
jgi:hypothetical protein